MLAGFLMPLRWGPEFLGVNMADEQAAQAVESTENTEAAQSDSVEALGEGGKKALDAERKRAAEAEKQAKALQAQLDALNDAKLTETERLQKQLDALTSDYRAAQVDAARNRVAAEEQIPAGLVGYLAGDDESAIRESAKVLKSAIAEAAKPGTPAPDPSQGASGAGVGGSTTSQFEQFFNSKLG